MNTNPVQIQHVDNQSSTIYFTENGHDYRLPISWMELEAWLEQEAPCELRATEQWHNTMRGTVPPVILEYCHSALIDGQAEQVIEIENLN